MNHVVGMVNVWDQTHVLAIMDGLERHALKASLPASVVNVTSMLKISSRLSQISDKAMSLDTCHNLKIAFLIIIHMHYMQMLAKIAACTARLLTCSAIRLRDLILQSSMHGVCMEN